MSDIVQQLAVMPFDGTVTHRAAPVQLINPDGTAYSGSFTAAKYVDDKSLTLKNLRAALIDAGLMEAESD